MTCDPFPTSIRALQCGCTVEALKDPSDYSPFADDIALHLDGPDAIPVCASWLILVGPIYSG